MGLNYAEHVAEAARTMDTPRDLPTHPVIFIKPPTAVIGPGAPIPHNQHVTIREQEVAGGKVRVLAHLYGGQGTMNVPSWSPDGKHVAFVSYTYGDPSI